MAYCVRITKEQEDACLKDINYSREQLAQDVVTIRRWLNEQEYLPSSCKKEKDCFIVHFLTGCKGSLEKTKKKLLAYYTAKSSNCVLNKNLDPFSDSLIHARNCHQVTVLPRALPDGTRVCLARMGPGTFNGDHVGVLKTGYMQWEVMLRWDHEIRSNKWISVVDAKNIQPEMVTGLSPSLAKEGFYLLQHTMPFRVKNIIYINCPKFVDVCVNYLVKPFLSKKLRERVIVTSEGSECLTKWIPKDVLPKDYGGDAPTFMEIYNDYQKEENSVAHLLANDWAEKIDESKRPPDLIYEDNPEFGLYGSIKKLCVD